MNYQIKFFNQIILFGFFILLGSISNCAQAQTGEYLTPEEKRLHVKQLIKALESVFPGSTISNEDAVKYIYAYLKNDGVSLNQYLGGTGSGTVAFNKLANHIMKDSILVLGTPGQLIATKGRIKDAEERMKVPLPKGMTEWKFYTCNSLHTRRAAGKVERQQHDGVVNFVRVTLPKYADDEKTINTPIGEVHPNDHLLFSNEGLSKYYFNLCFPNGPDSPGISLYNKLPDFERIDLITPARYNWMRFAPLAIFMVYAKATDKEPAFYLMEGGNGLGFCKVMYVSPTIDTKKPILMDGGYRPTGFSNSWNYYLAKTEFENDNPTHVSIKIYTRKEILSVPFKHLGMDSMFHFQINMRLEPRNIQEVAGFDSFIPPAKQVFEAFLRIEQLTAMGVPTTENNCTEKRYTHLSQKITRLASEGKPYACEERKLNRIKMKMSDVLNPK